MMKPALRTLGEEVPVERWRIVVLHVSGEPIEGLYAAGNVAASLAGAGYPGPGITIGAALLWGHLAARDAAGNG
jgi:3-oxosteroid 1-dehydrogenase